MQFKPSRYTIYFFTQWLKVTFCIHFIIIHNSSSHITIVHLVRKKNPKDILLKFTPINSELND